MLDSVLRHYSFPTPEPSYTPQAPLRVYTEAGYYYKIADDDPEPYSDFDANFFWLGNVGTDAAVPCIGFPHANGSQVIIYAHANAEDVWRCEKHLSWMRQQFGCHVVGFEYPGYEPAPGKATEESCLESLEVLYRHLRDERGFAPEDIILFGRSIGTGICTLFASRNKIACLLLLSPFTSIKNAVQYAGGHTTIGGMASAFIGDMFRSIDTIPLVQAPILVIHGTEDTICPSYMGQQIHAAATYHVKRLVLIKDMGHNDVFSDDFRDRTRTAISNFLQNYNIIKPGRARPLCAMDSLRRAPSLTAADVINFWTPAKRQEHLDLLAGMIADLTRKDQLDDNAARDSDTVFSQGMQMLTKLQILFSLVDLTNNKRLTVSEVELLLQALHQHCAAIGYSVPAAQTTTAGRRQITRRVFEMWDHEFDGGDLSEGALEFREFSQLMIMSEHFAMPLHPSVALQMQMIASQGGSDGLEMDWMMADLMRIGSEVLSAKDSQGRYQELPRHESTLTRAVAAQQDAAACAEAALAVEKAEYSRMRRASVDRQRAQEYVDKRKGKLPNHGTWA